MTSKVLQMLIVGGVISGSKLSLDTSESGNQQSDNVVRECGDSCARNDSYDAARVARIRAEIARGEYLTPRKLAATIERVMRDL